MSNQLSASELEEFHAESSEMLDQSEQSLLKLESGADFQAEYQAIFRVLHSLKGAAGMLGMDQLQHHMHQLESNLVLCDKKKSITKPQITYFLKGLDVARKILSNAEVKFDLTFPSESENISQATPTSTATPTPTSTPSPAVTPATAPKESAGIIYAIDDEEDILETLKLILSTKDYEVSTFSSAQDFLTAFKNKKPDLIISDINMPVMDGNQLLDAVRKQDPDVPFMFVSGYLSTETLINAINKGVFAVLEKPFTPNTLLTHISHAIRDIRLKKLLNKTINLIMYQFSDLQNFLIQSGKEHVGETIKQEINELLEARRQLRAARSNKQNQI